MHSVSAVGFDLDGTLLDFDGSANAALRNWMQARGLAHYGHETSDEWHRLAQLHFQRYVRGETTFEEQGQARVAGLLTWLGLDAGQFPLDTLFDEYRSYYETSAIAFEDALPMLSELRKLPLRLGVLTNGQKRQKLAHLHALGFMTAMSVVLASSELPAAKPSAGAFERLCSELGVPPASVLYVGDDLDVDYHGAAAAGLRAVWLNRRGQAVPDGVLAIESLSELAQLL